MADQQQQFQRVDLFAPMMASRVGPPPIVLRVGVTRTRDEMVGGVPQSALRAESYVLLSALPEEIRHRVELAVQALIAGM